MQFSSVSEILGEHGPFVDRLEGFAARPQQQALAEAVARALVHGGPLVGEAGTGVGKTFAYLVPAIRSGEKVLISTGTRHLQDQLFYKDLPLVRQALGADLDAALLKGRANYLCRHRLAAAAGHPSVNAPELEVQLAMVQEWASGTQTGEISEATALPEDSPIWHLVTSDADFCAQHEPGEVNDCFVHRARRQAMKARHRGSEPPPVLRRLMLKEGGFGEVLPQVGAVILDEAHQIPEVASQFFGQRLTSRQLRELARDCAIEQQRDARDIGELRDFSTALERESHKFRLALGREIRRTAWQEVARRSEVREALMRLDRVYQQLHTVLEVAAPRGKGLSACLRRCESQREVIGTFVDARSRGEWIHWFETFRNGFVLSQTPLNIAGPYQRMAKDMG